jgi:hypothetical protein
MKVPFPPRIQQALTQLRSALSISGVLLLFSPTSTALAIPMSGDISISGSATFNKRSLMKASDITGWMEPHVLSDSGAFAAFATRGSGVTMSTPWFFGSSTSSFVLWSTGGFTFDLTSSSVLSKSRKSLSLDGTGTVTGNGFNGAAGDWSFTFNKRKHHRRAFLFSFTAASQVVTPPPTGTPPPTHNVPDSGSTLVLLSFGLLGFACFRPNQIQKVRSRVRY